MKAIVRIKGGANLAAMQLQELPSPEPQPTQIKIRMAAARINPVDVDLMKGMPFLKYQAPQIGGIDGSGQVVEVGSAVTDWKEGDQVFFYRRFTDIGTWAEEICIDAADVARIPSSLSLEQAGAISLPLLTAYESLQQLQAQVGEKILIHGAGGGVGFQAVQLALAKGLKVYANAGPNDLEVLNALGVEGAFNYKAEDFASELSPGEIDYVFDVIGKETLMKSIRLASKRVVSVAYVEPALMSKTGIRLPGMLKWLMRISMGKYRRAARRAGVELLAQVTGANGKLLAEAASVVSDQDYQLRPYQEISLEEINANGFGDRPVGKVILLN